MTAKPMTNEKIKDKSLKIKVGIHLLLPLNRLTINDGTTNDQSLMTNDTKYPINHPIK